MSDRMNAPEAVRPSDYSTAVIVCVVAATVFLLFGQTTLYHNDGHRILTLLSSGDLDFGRHHAAMPVFHLFHRFVGEPLGLPPYRSVTVLGAISTAVATAGVYLSVRSLGYRTRASLVSAGLFAVQFPVFFFATVVEFHALFVSTAVVVYWLACRWQRAGGGGLALLFGVGAGLSTQLHSTGLFLTILFGAWTLASSHGRPLARTLLELVAAMAAHLATVTAFAFYWRALGWQVGGALHSTVRGFDLIPYALPRLPTAAWTEFFRPFAPLSLLPVVALFRSDFRRAGASLLIASVPYLALSAIILGVSEHGAYLVPFAALLSLLAVQMLSLRIAVAMMIVTGIVNGTITWYRDSEAEHYRAFLDGVHQIAGSDPVLILYCEDPVPGIPQPVDELAALCVFEPTMPYLRIEQLAREAEGLHDRALPMAAALRAIYPDSRLLMGAGSHTRLRERYPNGPLLLQALKQVYRFIPLHVAGFDGYELLSK